MEHLDRTPTGEAIREAEAEVAPAPAPEGAPAAEAPATAGRPPWESTPAPSAEALPSYGTGPGGYEPTNPSYQDGTAGAYQPPPPPAGGAWQAPSSAYYTARAPTPNTKAIWALVLAILSIFPGWVFGLGILISNDP